MIKTFKNILNNNAFELISYKNKKNFMFYYDKTDIYIEHRLPLNELYNIYNALKSTEDIKGINIEIGVLHGATSNFITWVDPNKKLYLFDTFKGIQGVTKFNNTWLEADYKTVKKKLGVYDNVKIFKGVFPKDTSTVLATKKIAFCHLDIDLYEGTLESLNFIWPKMCIKGIILIHDCKFKHGRITEPDEAVNDFLSKNNAIDLRLSGSHRCLIKC